MLVLKSSNKKGSFIERLLALPAWSPIYSLESVDGKTWQELASDFNTCWVLSEDNLYHYNQYGSLLEKLPSGAIESLAVYDEKLFSIQNEKLYIKSKTKPFWQEIKNIPQGIQAFYLKAGNLYLYRSELISIYKLKLPKS